MARWSSRIFTCWSLLSVFAEVAAKLTAIISEPPIEADKDGWEVVVDGGKLRELV